MRCVSCNSENPTGATFCGSCGSSQAAATTCHSCGSKNSASAEFCPSCGISARSAQAQESGNEFKPIAEPSRTGSGLRSKPAVILLGLGLVVVGIAVLAANRPLPGLHGRWTSNCGEPSTELQTNVSIEFADSGVVIVESAGDVDRGTFRITQVGHLEFTGDGETRLGGYSVAGDSLTLSGDLGDLSACSPWQRVS